MKAFCPRCCRVDESHFRTLRGPSVLCIRCVSEVYRRAPDPFYQQAYRDDVLLAVDGFDGSRPRWTYTAPVVGRTVGLKPSSVRSRRSRLFRRLTKES